MTRKVNLRLWNHSYLVCRCLKENTYDYSQWTYQKVRKDDRGGPDLVRSEAGPDRRISRAERRRKNDHHAHAHLLSDADGRHGYRGRIRYSGAAARSEEAHRLSSRNAADLPGDENRRIPGIRRPT